MKNKLALLAALLACSAAHSFVVDPDVYFGIASMNRGKYTMVISRQACKTPTIIKGKWMKAAIRVRYDDGQTEMIDACWQHHKETDGAGDVSELRVCAVIDGVLRTPCRNTVYEAFTKTVDLPKAPSQADF